MPAADLDRQLCDKDTKKTELLNVFFKSLFIDRPASHNPRFSSLKDKLEPEGLISPWSKLRKI